MRWAREYLPSWYNTGSGNSPAAPLQLCNQQCGSCFYSNLAVPLFAIIQIEEHMKLIRNPKVVLSSINMREKRNAHGFDMVQSVLHSKCNLDARIANRRNYTLFLFALIWPNRTIDDDDNSISIEISFHYLLQFDCGYTARRESFLRIVLPKSALPSAVCGKCWSLPVDNGSHE